MKPMQVQQKIKMVRKSNKSRTPNPYRLLQEHGGSIDSTVKKEVCHYCFEDKICRLYLSACQFSPKRIKQFSTDEYDCIALKNIDLPYSIKIINHKFEPAVLFDRPSQFSELYRHYTANILILNDFDKEDYSKQKDGGIALASFQNIGFESITGTMAIIAGDNGERLMIGKTTDMFAALAAAGILPAWDGIFE